MISRQASSLIIASDRIQQRLLAEPFFELGFRVMTAGSSEEAVDCVQSHHFTTAVIEGDLPAINGWRLARIMKRMRPEMAICVVEGDQQPEPSPDERFFSAVNGPVIHRKLLRIAQRSAALHSVLVVDDDYKFVSQMAQLWLRKRYQTYHARNSESAFAQLALNRFDAVLVNTAIRESIARDLYEAAAVANPGVLFGRLTEKVSQSDVNTSAALPQHTIHSKQNEPKVVARQIIQWLSESLAAMPKTVESR